MAKKTPVKKSKRRLKRGVRRSLAAVLMITAIGVAAIPVPENYAEEERVEEGDTPGTSTSSDVHSKELAGDENTPGFKYSPDPDDPNKEESLRSSRNFRLDYYANASIGQLVDMLDGVLDGDTAEDEDSEEDENAEEDGVIPDNAPQVYASLSVTETGSGENVEYSLNWQFMYYYQKNPDADGDGGVICRYNQSFYSPDVNLDLYPITNYFVVTQEDVETYFNSANWKKGEGDSAVDIRPNLPVKMDNTRPDTAHIYKYTDYKSKLDADDFLEYYFKDDLDKLRKSWDSFVDTDATPENNVFSKTALDITDTDLQIEYFMEHCYEIQQAFASKSDYVLRPAHDIRPGHGGEAWLVKAINIKSGSFYRKGDYDFLASEPTDFPMIAIGDKAFSGVKNVETMTLPDQLRHIGNEAFLGATMLRSITLVNVPIIGNRAFKGCTALDTVNLASTTEVIGQECFSGATKLKSIAFGGNVTKIGYGAFQGCIGLTAISFTDGGQACVVGDYAFYDCTALTDVSMENSSVSKLGSGAFAVVAGGEPIGFVLPKLMSASDSIGNFLFAGRSRLEYVVFPLRYGYSSTATIPDSIFHNCVGLQYIEFPCTDDQWAGGCVKFNPALFADVITKDFYVQGPKTNSSGEVAYPRESTWKAVTAVSKTVPYKYIDGGVEYYEVSDGFYLLCIDGEGLLTSCTLVPGAKLENWDKELVIPSVVGDTKVTGIASDCFKDSQLNENVKSLVIEDDSVSSIADGAFQAGGGDNKKDWLKLEKVYIGNSVESVGKDAFRNCRNLIDVTFASPSAGHEAFTIGENAFTTQSQQLTFHGDIVKGYDPFDWAMDPNNVIETEHRLRVCYKSLLPTYLTVMYNPITEMVTLLDYPKYGEIDLILKDAYADEIRGYGSYEAWREATLYAQYGTNTNKTNDLLRVDFANAWQTWVAEGKDRDALEQLYASNLYGPWIYPGFDVKFWANYDPDSSGDQIDQGSTGKKGNKLTDWLFEPIIAHAAEEAPSDNPLPYFKKNPYNVALADSNPYATQIERSLIYYAKNIVIPEGVESIDVFGYVNDITLDGQDNKEVKVVDDTNYANVSTYLTSRSGWQNASKDMYQREFPADEDGIRSVPGLFSGYYDDGTATTKEERKRGNDVIISVTMNSVKYLPDYAFDSCENLDYVILGPACADIGKAPFRGCHSMRTVGDNDYYTTVNGIIYSVNTDGSYTIEECLAGRGNLVGQAVISASIDPDITNVSAIKPGAFEDCDYLSEVNFGSRDTAGLALIPEDCFKNCDRLQTVTLPMTTNEVEKGAFVGANNLTGLTVYGKEVQISARAFDGAKDQWTTVRAYADSAVVRYVKQYGDEYLLRYDDQNPLGEIWQVSFYDANYVLIEDLKDKDGNDLDNPQYVEDGARPIEPEPPTMEGWTFERWVGNNNVNLGDAIHEDTSFYAQGYTESGMVNGKYPVTFWDGVDGTQVGPTQNVEPGKDAVAPGHPVHAGYEQDGYSDTYTNIQSPKTIILKYKPIGTSGGGSNTPGSGSSGSTSKSSSTSSSTSTSSTTSGSGTPAKYTVTVENGSGSGSYDVGSTVIIAANTPPAGMVFQKWTTESNGVALASVSMTATTFVMPANNVTVTANYVAGGSNAGTSGTVGGNTGGNTGGTTGNGSTRVDITKPGISNKDLATANVNGSSDNFVVKITETDEATRMVADALTNKYGSLENILYYAMDISLYDATGTVKITNTSGLSVDITIPIPDALVAYGGNNMAGAVINGNQLENLNESFTTINGVPCIRFTATHFSPYTIYVDTGNLTEGMLDTTPKTGDPIHPKWFLSIGLACLSVILFMKKDKAVKVKTA